VIRLAVEDGAIEMLEYSEDASLSELRICVEETREQEGLKTADCAGCGECCFYENLPILGYDIGPLAENLDLTIEQLFDKWVTRPDPPDIDERRNAIRDLERQQKVSSEVAALLYEYNQAEPIRFAKSEAGSCLFLKDNLCTIYNIRPYTCALYVCNMGEKLSILQEQIVRQGVWHSYFLMDWVSKKDISHNPFLRHNSYDELLISEFEFDLESALENLFFYF
jgi:Fe-S-cluster containining protein